MWKKSSYSNSQGNCVEVMPIISVPDGWSVSLEASSNLITYSFINNDNSTEFIIIRIKVNSKAAVFTSTFNHSGNEIGPEMELVFAEFPRGVELSPVEIFYYVVMKYRDFYHEYGSHQLENLMLSCLADFCVRRPVIESIAQDGPSIVMQEKPEGF